MHKKLCESPECLECYEKSFASHERASSWSARNAVSPRKVFKCSGKRYFFDCETCGHEYEMKLDNVQKGQGCSYCSFHRICDSDSCIRCFDLSFASHPKSELWSFDKNTVSPRQVMKHTHVKYWFKCQTCNHELLKSPHVVAGQGTWCVYCTNQSLCENVKCMYCFKKTFASTERAKFWSNINSLKPHEVFK